jgi:sortase (surface protein transpeptidase)
MPMRRSIATLLVGLLSLGSVVFTPGAVASAAAGDRFCFTETKYCAENAFLDFWRANGGLEILGFPVSQPFVDNRGLIVQFYERAIMEWHPENSDPRYQVLLTLLGNDLVADRPERNTPPVACDVDPCHLFTETNHTLRGAFYTYWASNGGLAVFGFPKTEQFVEVNQADGKEYIVQYFERNRFEYHPEQSNPRYQVLLGLLGLESLNTQRGVLDRPTAQVPDYPRSAATVGLPTTLSIPAIGVSAPIVGVGLDANGNMDSPKTATDTAWYSPGPRPGQPGNAAVAGHVDFAGVGPAVFWDLQQLGVGSEIFVTDDQGKRRRFLVTEIASYLVSEAPLERIFGPSGEANLNLISCLGNFDPVSRSYDRRIVVYTRWDGITP